MPNTVDGVDALEDLPDVCPDGGLGPHQAAQVGETIDDLLDGADLYLNSGQGAITRVAGVHGGEVHILAYTASWKWLGPKEPADPHEYLTGRGYVHVPETEGEDGEPDEEDLDEPAEVKADAD